MSPSEEALDGENPGDSSLFSNVEITFDPSRPSTSCGVLAGRSVGFGNDVDDEHPSSSSIHGTAQQIEARNVCIKRHMDVVE